MKDLYPFQVTYYILPPLSVTFERKVRIQRMEEKANKKNLSSHPFIEN